MIDEWTPVQTLALYDFCRLMSETIWNRYEDVLIEELLRRERPGRDETADTAEPCTINLELPFNDEVPY